ncbi:hypothetical protein KP696_13470 [Nocardia seriolae]|nr:hypothetical protein [Nocardia seriolae]MTJ66805.1 hypothetical protein [Nocardia seriolae]MTJ70396.1 hypothetical protein [Nocardia seriolae]MTJ85359.1 hypothetical protein [Nocardia seriolae]MTK29355.1 hypothetical protein [Nocardia seriolae]MTK44738.1 hypothetical protein [Nocardia seriolae]
MTTPKQVHQPGQSRSRRSGVPVPRETVLEAVASLRERIAELEGENTALPAAAAGQPG